MSISGGSPEDLELEKALQIRRRKMNRWIYILFAGIAIAAPFVAGRISDKIHARLVSICPECFRQALDLHVDQLTPTLNPSTTHDNSFVILPSGAVLNSVTVVPRPTVSPVVSLESTPTLSAPTPTFANRLVEGQKILASPPSESKKYTSRRLTRLTENGKIAQGFALDTFIEGSVESLAVDARGRAIVVIRESGDQSAEKNSLLRFNLSGTRDLDWSYLPRRPGAKPLTAVVQAGVKVVVVEETVDKTGLRKYLLSRLNESGTLDESFSSKAEFSGRVFGIHVDAESRLYVYGEMTQHNGFSTNKVIRMSKDGVLDPGFEADTLSYLSVTSLNLDSNGRAIVSTTSREEDVTTQSSILRLTQNGRIDSSFKSKIKILGVVKAITVDRVGRIYMGGDFKIRGQENLVNFLRLNPNGQIDRIDENSLVFDGPVYAIDTEKSGGGVVVGGGFGTCRGQDSSRFSKISFQGECRQDPQVNFRFDQSVMAIQKDGQGGFWVGGDFDMYDDPSMSLVAFMKNTKGADRFVPLHFDMHLNPRAHHVDARGDLLLSGDHIETYGKVKTKFVRVSSGGVLNQGIDLHFVSEGSVDAVATDSKGQIVLGGNFRVKGPSVERAKGIFHNLLRLDYMGQLDRTFKTHGGPNGSVKFIKRAQNDRIWVGGEFTSFAGRVASGLVRLNIDGSVDSTFQFPKEGPKILDIYSEKLGTLLVGFEGKQSGLRRYREDGKLDPTFRPVLYPNAELTAFSEDEHGRILVAQKIEGKTQAFTKIFRLLSNGSVDVEFHFSPEFFGKVRSLLSLDNGSIVVGGENLISTSSNLFLGPLASFSTFDGRVEEVADFSDKHSSVLGMAPIDGGRIFIVKQRIPLSR